MRGPIPLLIPALRILCARRERKLININKEGRHLSHARRHFSVRSMTLVSQTIPHVYNEEKG